MLRLSCLSFGLGRLCLLIMSMEGDADRVKFVVDT